MRKIILTLALSSLCFGICRADEGMWLPSLIGNRVKDMRSKGFKLTAKDIYDVNHASMKDAVVKFGNGCSAELISAQGLLLTNHHCGYAQIQSHSSLDHDYLTNGFWAMNRTEELPNPELTATFLVRMDDVTAAVMRGISDGMFPAQKAEVMKRNKASLISSATDGTGYQASVESFYYGNQYFLFVYEVYQDVRLVAAPASSIGKFGGDTDNWMWPRHTGDFSVFRIYADPDNKPAKYSPSNVPYRSKEFFAISTSGVKEGDFTFIYGLPARTSEYLVSDAVDYIQNVSDPAKIALRTMRLDVIKQASSQDPKIRIMYAAKAANIANAWKKWQGEQLGLERLGTVESKRAAENDFSKWAASLPDSDPRAAAYRAVLPQMHRLYGELGELALARDYYMEAFKGIELMNFAETLLNCKTVDAARAAAADFYKDYSPEIDRKIARMLLSEYMEKVPARFVPQSARDMVARMGFDASVDAIFDYSALTQRTGVDWADSTAVAKVIYGQSKLEDPVLTTYKTLRQVYDSQISPRYTAINDSINALYTVYMKALMDKDPGHDFYPDANFTLRVAYGHVEGYDVSDGVRHIYRTTLDGIMQKDDPTVYDYNIPQRLRDLYAAKDYGRWADKGVMPVAFLATNHTSGGNSGSPVLDGRGRLIGLNFDRTWLSTMSDIEFDPVMCRNVSVDIRYVMFVIDKVGGAGWLLDEMKFVD